MSRIGKKQISLPEKVEVKVESENNVVVEGPKGKLEWSMPKGLKLENEDGSLEIVRESEDRKTRAMHGTARALVSNMVEGVSAGFVKELEIQGVGFRAKVEKDGLDLNLGFSHPVVHPIPSELTVTVEENTKIKVEGIDKQQVGQFASDVRSYYPPEPYKGKGIRYKGEQVRRKQGKSVK
ncbi:MAG: 50S ribosomal protein L6 [Verrucomicrobiales bacterium]|nr:50S ribosomal protein L6 [Verrucomicrobiales bacterium]